VRAHELDVQAPVESLRTDGRVVGFRILEPQPIQFDAVAGARWMTGVLGSPSRQYPFILRRDE
jgi:hypothetical protein